MSEVKRYFILALFLLISCNSPNEKHFHFQEFEGRLKTVPIYRAEVPLDWKSIPLENDHYLNDTMLPIAVFMIDGIRLTVHNFPSDSLEQRISPYAQVARWEKQFSSLDSSSDTTPVAWGGFSGLLFEASGAINKNPTTMLAVAMQLPSEYYQTFKENEVNRQKRADYTIKVLGSPEKVQANREELLAFIESFELIDEIPLSR